MEKHILLLANSKKLGGRCLAGVEVLFIGESPVFRFQDQLKPVWLRPVSRSPHGEVSHALADRFQVMDVVKVDGYEPSPDAYQSENIHFQRLESLGSDFFEVDDLGYISLASPEATFGNRGNAVHVDQIQRVDHSLLMVEPQAFTSYMRAYDDGKTQLRGQYQLNGAHYDQPITDPAFHLGDEKGQHAYLTLSLGLEHEGYHSKLIAAVVLS